MAARGGAGGVSAIGGAAGSAVRAGLPEHFELGGLFPQIAHGGDVGAVHTAKLRRYVPRAQWCCVKLRQLFGVGRLDMARVMRFRAGEPVMAQRCSSSNFLA